MTETAKWRLTGVLAACSLTAAVAGCSSTAYRFLDAAPVTVFDDRGPTPVPARSEYRSLLYGIDALAREPVLRALDVSPPTEAGDVSSHDDVPESSWFTPRLGYRDLSPEDLLRGVGEVGPPEPPVRVVKAKVGGGNPGFIIADARGERYLMKFDPPDHPAVETTTALIVNRLFWGFGYNVPEDYQFFFRSEDLGVDPEGELTSANVREVLAAVAPPVEGVYRSTVSHFLDGIILGPVQDRGVREGDVNDVVPHEDRRVLRALRVFGAFVNHSDMRIDNSLAVYVGEPGEGHVERYLLDFGEAFGGHGAEHDRLWDGFDNYFSYSEFFGNLVTLGTRVHAWEDVRYTPWKSVGAFESIRFDPAGWKPVKPFAPIVRSQPADDYWAAKILGGLTRDHIVALVEAARYPEPDAADYMVETLIERRRKTLEFAFRDVSAVDAEGFSGGSLHVRDTARLLLGEGTGHSGYEIVLRDAAGRRIGEPLRLAGADRFAVPVSRDVLERANGYVRIDVRTVRDGRRAPSPAQFHVRSHGEGARLVGVVH